MEEALIWNISLLIAIIFLISYTLKRIADVAKVRVLRERKKGLGQSVTAALPNSLYELFGQLEVGLDMQVQEIAKRCNKEGKNPMNDTGYKTVLSQYEKVRDLKTKFETNPLYIMADQVGWPIVKAIVPDAIKFAKSVFKFA